MQSPRTVRRYRWLAILLTVMAASLLLWQTYRYARDSAIEDLRARSTDSLNLVVANLRGELSKYSFQPRLLSTSPVMIDAVAEPGSADAKARANSELVKINGVTGALATYLMNKDGVTVAASNWHLDGSFVDRNFAYRPYFQQAIEGRLGRFFALGTTSGERGYYFAYPVRRGASIVGAIVVKMDVTRLEEQWRSRNDQVVVVDEDGIVFISTEPSWLFKAFKDIDEATRQRLQATRRYSGRNLERLDMKRSPDGALLSLAGTELGDGEDERSDTGTKNYVFVARDMKEASWRIYILADASSVFERVQLALLVAGFMLVSAILLALNVYQRRRRLAERINSQERARAELEAKVFDRTKDLSAAVAQLRAEVSERERAETHLRQTQQDLIQASKLAALGSLSAGLSHELSQPLTAIRNYADNAAAFLAQGNATTAVSNLGRITEMSDRMARIIRNLKTYARKETQSVRPTRLDHALRNAAALIEPQLAQAGVELDMDEGDLSVTVMAGDVRLQQVFVNLMSNAMDAMAAAENKRLSVEVASDDSHVGVTVRDTGTGIEPSELERVFDPFFTTKDVGKGTGLGLSITVGIVNQFGGSITAGNNPDGGAYFTVKLLRADTRQEAAE